MPRAPRRIASLTVSTDEMLASLVSPDRIAAVTHFADDPTIELSAGFAPKSAARIRGIDPEGVVALQPDIVFVAHYTLESAVRILSSATIPVVRLREARSYDDVEANIRLLSSALGDEANEAQTDALIATMPSEARDRPATKPHFGAPGAPCALLRASGLYDRQRHTRRREVPARRRQERRPRSQARRLQERRGRSSRRTRPGHHHRAAMVHGRDDTGAGPDGKPCLARRLRGPSGARLRRRRGPPHVGISPERGRGGRAGTPVPPRGLFIVKRLAPAPVLAVGVVTLALTVLLAVRFGVANIGFAKMFGIARSALGVPGGVSWKPWEATILLDVRLPRIVTGVFVGAGLAISGAALQALFRNPLADPGVLGVASGASLGAVLAMHLGLSMFLAARDPDVRDRLRRAVCLLHLRDRLAARPPADRNAPSFRESRSEAWQRALTSLLLSLSLEEYEQAQARRSVGSWVAWKARTWAEALIAAPTTLLGAAIVVAAARELDALLLGAVQARGPQGRCAASETAAHLRHVGDHRQRRRRLGSGRLRGARGAPPGPAAGRTRSRRVAPRRACSSAPRSSSERTYSAERWSRRKRSGSA